MAKQTISYLKGRFHTGAKPTQSDFADIFDSFVHSDDLEIANNTAIDARITDYDSNQKELSNSGSVRTVGDVLDVFVGWDSSQRLKTALESIGGSPKWEDIQERPESLAVVWDEVQVSVDTFLAGNNAPQPPTNVMQLISPVSIARGIGGVSANEKTVVRDINATFFRVQVVGSSLQQWTQRINSVVFGVSPRVKLE